MSDQSRLRHVQRHAEWRFGWGWLLRNNPAVAEQISERARQYAEQVLEDSQADLHPDGYPREEMGT